jgi:hypothetical protein
MSATKKKWAATDAEATVANSRPFVNNCATYNNYIDKKMHRWVRKGNENSLFLTSVFSALMGLCLRSETPHRRTCTGR